MSSDEESMQQLYQWIDDIPLSRPKRSISRDFSDGVLAAELIAHFFPKLVDMHNYSAANSVSQKQYNWSTLNQKVFKKMGFNVAQDQVKLVCECGPGAIERVLSTIHTKVLEIQANGGKLHTSSTKARRPAAPQVPASAPIAKPKTVVSKPVVARQPATSQPVPRHRQNRQQPQRAAQQTEWGAATEEPAMSRPTYNLPLVQPGSARQAPVVPVAQQPQRMNMMTELDRSLDRAEVPELCDVDTEILVEKETTILELRETVLILETKIQKMEQLLKLKDQKITKLQSTLAAQ